MAQGEQALQEFRAGQNHRPAMRRWQDRLSQWRQSCSGRIVRNANVGHYCVLAAWLADVIVLDCWAGIIGAKGFAGWRLESSKESRETLGIAFTVDSLHVSRWAQPETSF